MTKLYLDIEEIKKRPNDMELGDYVRKQSFKKEKLMKQDYVAEIMQKWYDAMANDNVQVQPKTSTMLGTILAGYDIKPKSKPAKENLWNQYMNTKGGDFQAFWSSLSVDERSYIDARRQQMRDKYYAERGLKDDNRKILKG
jgi:hypothetical protein|tara:strand:- start:263 stop:685 length:423 start_codon:yes stop_codon:yes gene_type:complete